MVSAPNKLISQEVYVGKPIVREGSANVNTLQYDIDLDNAIYFCHYITVLKDGRMTGGGTIKAYDEQEVQVGDRWHSREKSSFIASPPPQTYINF